MKTIYYLLMLGVLCGNTVDAQVIAPAPATIGLPAPPSATSASPQSQTLITEPNSIVQAPATAPASQTGVAVSGTVVDAQNQSLPGVTVAVKGTGTPDRMRGTTTDTDGKFQLTVADNQTVLAFSYIGFAPQEVVVGNQTTINVTLAEDSQTLNEVVVVG